MKIPGRSFALEITMDLVAGARHFSQKQPLHFHVQHEYVECIQGKLGVELEGAAGDLILSPAEGRSAIPPWRHHRLYPVPLEEQGDGTTVVTFLLSGGKAESAFELNAVFFENWYKYQDEIVLRGAPVDLIQVLCVSAAWISLISHRCPFHVSDLDLKTFDAGGTYITLPGWIPFGKRFSIILGVVLGRWIGSGLLGYQPFYRKWTTDWDLACQKMDTSIFQKRYAQLGKNE